MQNVDSNSTKNNANMSYDLYFFKRKESKISEKEIENYLSENLVAEQNGQWIFQNEDTEVYFVFEKNETEIEEDDIEFEENQYISKQFFFQKNLNKKPNN